MTEGLVTSVLGPATDGRDRTAIDALAADLEKRLDAQLAAVTQHEAFGKLEAAWRGLRFLVDRIDSRSGVSLEVLPAGKDELAPAVYHQVLMPEYAASGTRAPLGACLVAQAFDRSADDVALLQDLAETGASLQVPFIAEAGPAFFGLETMAGLAKWSVDDLRGPDYIPWQKMRREESAQYLAVALPSFHLRAEGDEPLLGSAVLAAAAALSRAFVETGWTFQLGDAELEGMAVRRHRDTATPLSAVLGRRKEDELADAGFVVLTAPQNADRLRVRHAPVVWQPTSGSLDVRLPDAPDLPGQLFAAQVAQGLLAFREALLKQRDAFTGVDDLVARLRDRFGMRDAPEDALQMEEMETEEGAERLFLLRIAARDRARGEMRALALHLPVPRAGGSG